MLAGSREHHFISRYNTLPDRHLSIPESILIIYSKSIYHEKTLFNIPGFSFNSK